MTYDFTPEETQFMVSLLLNPDCAAPVEMVDVRRAIGNKLLLLLPAQLEGSDVTNIQYLLQGQAEINGSRRSVANEKAFMGPGTTFIPQRTLQLIQSIMNKLGAAISVDTRTQTDVPDDHRAEGSPQVLQDPRIKPVGVF